jgi:hypothetical protein
MRIAVLLLAVLLLAAGCGSRRHTSVLYSSKASRGDSPAGSQAGGPAKLVVHGDAVTAKGLLVVRTTRGQVVVRTPGGGTLTIARPRAQVVHVGERVSFTGTKNGKAVSVKTLSVTGR